MVIVAPEIERYLAGFLRRRHPALKRMEALAGRRRYGVGRGRSIPFPIVGPVVGALLAHYARLVGARRVFELGSGYGYSAFWFAQAVGPRGRVDCTDTDPENARLGAAFFRRAGLASRVRYHVGDGVDFIGKEANASLDVVFIDMEKSRYPRGLKAALPKVRRGGLIIADNVLWSGDVLRPARDAATRGLKEYTRLVTSSSALSTVIHPIRDGVAVSLKIGGK
jgi:predicted O-methyltransferase YrrM